MRELRLSKIPDLSGLFQLARGFFLREFWVFICVVERCSDVSFSTLGDSILCANRW